MAKNSPISWGPGRCVEISSLSLISRYFDSFSYLYCLLTRVTANILPTGPLQTAVSRFTVFKWLVPIRQHHLLTHSLKLEDQLLFQTNGRQLTLCHWEMLSWCFSVGLWGHWEMLSWCFSVGLWGPMLWGYESGASLSAICETVSLPTCF